MLNERPLWPTEVIKRWDDGFVAAWALLREGDVGIKDFDGLRLIVRTEGKAPNAYAMAFISREQIEDDEAEIVLNGVLKKLRHDCEQVLLTA